MATVNKKIAEAIIQSAGYYKDDPRVSQVIKYENAFGGTSWAIAYPGQEDRYLESEFVRRPEILWKAN